MYNIVYIFPPLEKKSFTKIVTVKQFSMLSVKFLKSKIYLLLLIDSFKFPPIQHAKEFLAEPLANQAKLSPTLWEPIVARV